MAERVTNYQCPACTAPLHFEASTGRVKCDFCESEYTVAQIESFYEQRDAAAADAAAVDDAVADAAAAADSAAAAAATADDAVSAAAPDSGWSEVVSGDAWDAEADGFRAYNCPSCGAELICDESTAATACPYCDNPTIIPGQLRGALRPDFVIPFKLKKEDAIAALRRHYEGRPFLPKVFKDENHLQEIKGVYVPFWLFDGEAVGRARYDCARTRTFPVGDTLVTETDHYDAYREGAVAFSKIPVDASSKMDDDYMDSLEPFDYAEMQPFSSAYLPGFFADRYDESIDACGGRASTRAADTLEASLRATVTGYTAVIDRGVTVSHKRGKVSYALLPVWLLNTRWNGEVYRFAMNGQTGKFVGHLPTDKGKRLRTFAAVYAAGFAVMLVVALIAGGSLGLFGALGM